MMSLAIKLRTLAGAIVLDLPRYLWSLHGDARWLHIHNRRERLRTGPDGEGVQCEWQWTSDLHAPKVLPQLGTRLLQRALTQHPVRRERGAAAADPQVSFLIGHRGEARVPHLLATLETIAAQHSAKVECIVVEQDQEPRLPALLPAWVRYVHTAPPTRDMPYCRAWALNVAARHARAPLLVLHDGDMLLPADYAATAAARAARGFDVMNLKRFVFYLSAAHTRRYFEGRAQIADAAPEAVTQNLEAGGSVAITRDAFERIGGMDEGFIGWGGEDNEFWERAATLRVWPWADLPVVHLWHVAQPGKQNAASDAMQRYRTLAAKPAHERIAALRGRPRGRVDGPCGPALHWEARASAAD